MKQEIVAEKRTRKYRAEQSIEIYQSDEISNSINHVCAYLYFPGFLQ